MHTLSTLEVNKERREALFNKFTLLAVNHSDHFQPGFAAFYLSAFPDTPHSNIPAGILQGCLPSSSLNNLTLAFVGGLYDYLSDPLEHHVDQTDNPKVTCYIINTVLG